MLMLARDSTYADRLRAYSVWLDGKKIGSIRDGEMQKFDLSPGSHSLMLRIDWARSKKVLFDVPADKDVYFQCYSSVGGKGVLSRGISVYYYGTIGLNEYITLEQVDSIDPDILRRIEFRRSHPITELKGFTVTKLFYVSLFAACLFYVAILLNNVPYNLVSHTCVPNQSQQTVQLLTDMHRSDLISTNESKKYCNAGHHPELKRGWMLANETLGWLIALCVPFILSTGLIKLYRSSKQSKPEMIRY